MTRRLLWSLCLVLAVAASARAQSPTTGLVDLDAAN